MKKLSIAILFVFVISLFSGCTKQTVSNENKCVNTIKVVDCIGREVEIPKEVKKVACFYPTAAYAVTLLNKNIEIVAVASGLKRDILLEKLNPSMKDAEIAGSGRVVNIETLINEDPDLIIINENMAANEGETVKLTQSHIPYLVVHYKNMQEQQDFISILGKALGEEEKAKKYNQFYENYINLAKKRVKDIPDEKRVRVFYSMSEASRTETSQNIVSDWINAVGLCNVVEDEKLKLFDKVKHYASLEQIYIWDPDAFMVSDAQTTDYIKKNKKWQALKAVKNKKICQLPLGISRWGHESSLEIPLTLMWAGKTFYPEKFKDIDLKGEITTFYQDYFEYELSKDELEKIISGKGMRL